MTVPPEPGQGSPPPASSPWSRDYAGPAPSYPAPPPEPTRPAPPVWPAPPAVEPVWPAASQQGWPTAPQQPWPSAPQPGRPTRRSQRGLWAGVALVAVAIVATLIVVLVTSDSGSPSSSASGGNGQVIPNPLPSVIPTPAPSTGSPQAPIPSIAPVTTPPGLLAIGYRAYSITTVSPSDIALGPQELTEFKKDGLSRVVGLQALTAGPTSSAADDWNADINILQFSSPANALAELNYSNSQNKKTATTIPLPGLPNATAFVNHDPTTGISIGAFTTVGRYQVVLILGGLSANVPTNATVVAAEAAKVLKAVLPDAATIVPPASGSGGSGGNGGGGTIPAFPTPTPTGTHA